MAYLNDHPPARSQFRHPRREPVSGVIVVHTAENTPDFVAFDGGAEAVAKFIVGRTDPGSYHVLGDSDSTIQLVEFGDEAYHDGTGSNPHSIGISVATRADVWPLAPQEWRDGAVRNIARAAAAAAAYVKAKRGIVVPARRITRAESEARIPGFISHAERDPARRTDPGAGFPWTQFLTEYARFSGSTATTGGFLMALSDAAQDALAKQIRELWISCVPFAQDSHPADARFQVQQLLTRVLPSVDDVDIAAGVNEAFATAGSEVRRQLAGSADITGLIELALQRSPTFRALADKIDQLVQAAGTS